MEKSNKVYLRLFWAVVLLAYTATLFFLSSGPVDVPGPSFVFKDKFLHASAFGLLAVVAWRAFSLWSAIRTPFFWSWFYAMVYGASDEWHQSFVPSRHSDIWDWVADWVGAAIALSILYHIRRIQLSSSESVVDEIRTTSTRLS